MNSRIHAKKQQKRLFVPIASFAFDSFEVDVRLVKGRRPLARNRPADAAVAAKILLPSPSPQGRGLICLRSGRGRPCVRPRSLPRNSQSEVPDLAAVLP